MSQIREESNTKIDLPAENSNSETIVITGKRANCEAARHRILAIQKELVSEMTGLLQMRDLKMLLEDINTEEVLVVGEGRETNVCVGLFLTLKPKFVAAHGSGVASLKPSGQAFLTAPYSCLQRGNESSCRNIFAPTLLTL